MNSFIIRKGGGGSGGSGTQGPQGLKGDTGAQGVKGDTGAQGLQGIKGDTGAAGAAGGGGLQNNFAGVANPTATDDASKGYAVGSVWFRPDLGIMWRCRSATTNGAVWTRGDNADFFGFVSGRYYAQFGVSQFGAGTATPLGTMRLYPIIVKERVTINTLGVRISTASAGGLFGLAIYAADPATRYATGAPIVSVNALTTAAASLVTTAIPSTTLEPGIYWVATQFDNATATAVSLTNTGPFALSLIGTATAGNSITTAANFNFSYTGQTYGTWPDLTAMTPTEAAIATIQTPYVSMKVA